MLVLFETAAGFALFKLLDEKKLTQSEDLYHDFETPESASRIVKLKHFEKFRDTTEALVATTAAVEGKLSKSLKKMLKKQLVAKEVHDQLLVADAKLGNAIKNKLNLPCVSNTAVQELMRCIRSQLDNLLAGLPQKEMTAMALGLSHSLSRYKLKFSPDKIDTMIVHAVGALDELDKEVNNYIMRTKEWYGWHFPELSKIIPDNLAFVKTISLMGTRDQATSVDLSDLLPEQVETQVREAAETSMGTEIDDDDITYIQGLCTEVLKLTSYRTQLCEYLTARMMAMAPNLTVLVGDLVGARLIAKAGSLTNLAKQPASTIQVLGAEKALFRALKTRRETPKYGLIYHAQLVGQTKSILKGKISRMLAAKAALATRFDALGEDGDLSFGAEHKLKIESRIRYLEEGNIGRISGTAKAKMKFEKYHSKSEVRQYPVADDSTLPSTSKRRLSETEDVDVAPPLKKRKIKEGVFEVQKFGAVPVEPEEEGQDVTPKKKKKKKKVQIEEVSEEQSFEALAVKPEDEVEGGDQHRKKKKKKKKHHDAEAEATREAEVPDSGKKKKQTEQSEENVDEEAVSSEKKKKKKKRKSEEFGGSNDV